MDRQEVYKVIDSERTYQKKWENESITKGLHSISEYIAFMEDYLSEAKHILAREPLHNSYPKVTPIIRKVTALGVACMEQHGAPERK